MIEITILIIFLITAIIFFILVTKKALLLQDVLDDLVETYEPILKDLYEVKDQIVKLSKSDLFLDTPEVRELVKGIHKAKTTMEKLVFVIEAAKKTENNSKRNQEQKKINK